MITKKALPSGICGGSRHCTITHTRGQSAQQYTLQRGHIPKPLEGMNYANIYHPLLGTEYWAPEGAVPSVGSRGGEAVKPLEGRKKNASLEGARQDTQRGNIPKPLEGMK